MYEFQGVMRQWRRMCKAQNGHGGCGSCPLGFYCGFNPDVRTDTDIRMLEELIVKWADEHPEPVHADVAVERMRSNMEGLTKIGFDQIIERIVNRQFDPPRGKNLRALSDYLTGYADCQNDIISLLQELRDQYGR